MNVSQKGRLSMIQATKVLVKTLPCKLKTFATSYSLRKSRQFI